MAEVNPYQQPATDESPDRKPKKKAPVDPLTREVQRRIGRVLPGLLVILAATSGFVTSSLVLAVVDRFKPVSTLVLTATVVTTLVGLLVFAGAALAYLGWRAVVMGYPRRRLYAFGASGWALGLLCLVGIIRSDMGAEEKAAEEVCLPLAMAQGPGAPASAGERAERCKAAHIRCHRQLQRQASFATLTYDARNERMRACMAGSSAELR